MKQHGLLSVILLATMFFVPTNLLYAQNDPYSEAIVKNALTENVMMSFTEKQLSSLGDRAAIALVRSIGDRTINDPKEAQKVLWIVRLAFSVPQNITVPADRTPKAALFLVHCISESPLGAQLAGDIQTTKRAILSAKDIAKPIQR